MERKHTALGTLISLPGSDLSASEQQGGFTECLVIFSIRRARLIP